MDPLLEKYLNDEVSEDDFQKELDQKTPEEQAALRTQASDLKTDEFRQLKAVRLEKNRQNELVEEARKKAEEIAAGGTPAPVIPPEARQPSGPDFGTKFRDEQVAEAKKKFFTEFSIPVEEQPSYTEAFDKGGDSGHVSVNLILNDFKRLYVSRNPDEFIAAKRGYDEFARTADEFALEQAGGNGGGSGGSGGSGKTYPKEAYDLVSKARKGGDTKLTLDQATRYLRKGGERELG